MIRSFADLVTAGALRTQVVEVAGEQVRVRELTLAQRARMSELAASAPQQVSALLVEMGAVDEHGAPLVAAEDAQQLQSLRPELVEGIARAVLRLSGLVSEKGKDAPGKG